MYGRVASASSSGTGGTFSTEIAAGLGASAMALVARRIVAAAAMRIERNDGLPFSKKKSAVAAYSLPRVGRTRRERRHRRRLVLHRRGDLLGLAHHAQHVASGELGE